MTSRLINAIGLIAIGVFYKIIRCSLYGVLPSAESCSLLASSAVLFCFEKRTLVISSSIFAFCAVLLAFMIVYLVQIGLHSPQINFDFWFETSSMY